MKPKIKKDWYGRIKSIEELQDDSRLWLSEIDFINDEIRFFNHLIGQYYIECLDGGFLLKMKELITRISEEKNIVKTLKILIVEQRKVLAELIEKNNVTSNLNYLEKHKKLEKEVAGYFKKNRELKKQIFAIIDNILEKKVQKKLIQ